VRHRRTLLILVAFFLLAPSLCTSQQNDKLLCNRIFSFAFEHKLIEKPIGETIVAVGKQFLGKPYEANTLDKPDTERLVVDLHSFDCVTFVENVLALSRCIKSNRLSFDAYTQELQKIRYREGSLNGYASRLHYFSEWIQDNGKKGILHDLTKDLGGVPLGKQIDFMSRHRNLYPKLKNDSSFFRITSIESTLSQDSLFFIPKSNVRSTESSIRSGDLIAVTTTQEGLDVSHTGIAIRLQDGSLHLLHAPDAGDSVRISSERLSAYLKRHSQHTGIMVVRATEPDSSSR